MSGIIGKKVGMTRIFVDGENIPVTVIEAGPNRVVGVKTEEKNGYSAVALSFGKKSPKKTSKAMKTVFAKADSPVSAIVREFPNTKDNKLGDEVLVSVLDGSDYVDIIGTSKGKGFQGVMKRHNFAGGDASHGSTKFHRRPGSIGNLTSSGRVWPGRKMPGQMGNERVTVQNLKVIKIDPENNLLVVKGAVPGARNGYILIRPAIKRGGK